MFKISLKIIVYYCSEGGSLESKTPQCTRVDVDFENVESIDISTLQ